LPQPRSRLIGAVAGGVITLLAAGLWVQAGSVAWPNEDCCFFNFVSPGRLRQQKMPLTNEAYVWQRQWTPALSAALDQSSTMMDGWRVLAAHWNADGHSQPTSPDWETLNRSGKHVIPVVRIDRQMVHWDEDTLLAEIQTLLSQWRGRAKLLAGLEIDHDSPTARLPEYRHFLKRLRQQLSGTLRLSITILPSWMDSSDMDAVLEPIDEAVLQVHAVQAPQSGIFNRATAIRWIDRLSTCINKPFLVALPAYGARLALRKDGTILAVESEVPLLVGGSSFVELTVSPDEVSSLLRHLEAHRPDHMAGIAWFRLPVANDRRSWSLATLQAVMHGALPKSRVEVMVEDSDTPGMVTITLINPGEVDALLPRQLALPADCTIADGINGFTLAHEGRNVVLVRDQSTVLHDHHRLAVGWARCAPAAESIHVQQ
jgi:Protein of unknown function (DUF3142)